MADVVRLLGMAPPTWASPLLSIVGDPLHSASGDGAPALLTLSSAKMLLDRYLCCIRLQKCRIWTGTTYATFSACRARAVLLARRGSLASMRPRSRGALRASRDCWESACSSAMQVFLGRPTVGKSSSVEPSASNLTSTQ